MHPRKINNLKIKAKLILNILIHIALIGSLFIITIAVYNLPFKN